MCASFSILRPLHLLVPCYVFLWLILAQWHFALNCEYHP